MASPFVQAFSLAHLGGRFGRGLGEIGAIASTPPLFLARIGAANVRALSRCETPHKRKPDSA
jgi:hypothetical protein